MEKVKVLGIAPYEGMLNMMRSAASETRRHQPERFRGRSGQRRRDCGRYSIDDFDVIAHLPRRHRRNDPSEKRHTRRGNPDFRL